EAVYLLERADAPPFGGIRDIRPYLDRALVGALLQPQELLDIAETVGGVQRLGTYIRQKCKPESVLYDLGTGLGTHKRLETEIRRCISDEAQVKDSASPALAKMRSQMRTIQSRIRTRIESIMREAEAKKYLQEAL